MADPRATYEVRLETYRATLAELNRSEQVLSWIRLGLFSAFVVVGWLAFANHRFSGWWTLLPFIGFITAVAIHARVTNRKRLAERRARFCSLGIARIDRDWKSLPAIESELPEHHLYADDLDIVGQGSLLSLISTARTEAGRTTLLGWLLSPASADSVLERQKATSSLRDRLDLREDLFSIGGPEVADVRLNTFEDAAEGSEIPPAGIVVRVFALMVAIANVVTLIGWLTGGWPRLWFFASIVASALVVWLGRRHKASLHGVESLSDGLMLLETLLERFEQESFNDPALSRIHQTLIGGREAAAPGIRKLRRLVTLLDSQRNQVFYPIALMLLWETNLSFAIGRWRRRYGTHAAEWMSALAELEALMSLGSFSWENPDYVFPKISASPNPVFVARSAGHPLIAPPDLVRNDMRIDEQTRLLIVSGSNMSGKSTMLRTVGINTVLALAGAVVCAESLELNDLRLGASIQVRDSLLEGRSRFYAEILRLRDIVRAAEQTEHPFLFLLDEILHGTNSHDRRIGADAIVRSLLDLKASGLVTTHDLALARIADELPTARNVHFEDRIDAGEMIFDYRMKDGVVERSNAVELMRQIGLKV